MKISSVAGQEILDSRGNPTVEAEVILENGVKARADVPSGASTGRHEDLELRDGDESRYLGKGVLKAVSNVSGAIADTLKGSEIEDQAEIDNKMIKLDGTDEKENLGANAILAVSMACVKAAASFKQVPTYRYINELFGKDDDEFVMPIPMINVLNGGKHALGASDFQEYMIMPIGAPNIQEAVRWGSEIFHTLGKLLKEEGFQTSVGDEGGYAPSLGSNEKPLEFMISAIEKAGYTPGDQVSIALDPAASEFYKDGKYVLKVENKTISSEELTQLYLEWLDKYPIISIEDGHAEDDWDGFVDFTKRAGDRIQIMGDDLFTTDKHRLQRGIDIKAANSILIKVNKIGTVTEAIESIKLADEAGMASIVSHRSGETEDTFIADFVVGGETGQIKTGSLSRSERVAKYNQLMRIERELGEKSKIADFPFK